MATRVEVRSKDLFVPAMFVVTDDGEVLIDQVSALGTKKAVAASCQRLIAKATELADLLGCELWLP